MDNLETKSSVQLVEALKNAQQRIVILEAENKALKESENNFLITMEQSAISMQVYTPDGILRQFNPAFEALFGIDGATVVNKYNVFKDKKVVEVGALPYLKKALNGETVHNFINQYDAKVGFQADSGRKRWLKSCFYPIKDNHGEVRLFVIMHEDITELKQYQMKLEELVHEQTASLEKQNKALEKLLNIDALTQIANRRCFEHTLESLWKQLSTAQQPLSLLFIDIDCFKHYNDWYGHQVGDYCLTQVAQAIDKAVSDEHSLTARYGGEEFIVLLPHAASQIAKQTAQSIQQHIAALKIPHQKSTINAYITCSIGIVCDIPQAHMRIKTFISRADQAMYEAKRQGRNRFVMCACSWPE